MSTSKYQSEATYDVVVNEEEQYSIWPLNKEIPLGWAKAGKQGSKESCSEFITGAWTDMRPLSLRKQMESARS